MEENQDQKGHLFYEKKFPDEGEYVIVKIREINEYSIIVELLEYNNIEGMITLAEYSRTGKSKYNQQMLLIRKKINKNDVCQVIRVDKEKGNIDLSKRKIDQDQVKELEARYAKGKKVLSFMNNLA